MLDLGTRLELAAPAHGDVAMPLHGIDVTLWSAGAPPISGTVLEMSPRDLKLQLRADVKAGSIVELEVYSRLHGFNFSVRGQLHWRQPVGTNTIAGVFLYRALSHEVVSPFWSDLRKELRYPCDWACLIQQKRRRRSNPARLLNYSRSGVLIACRERLAGGDEISVLDPSQSNPTSIVSGIVRWISQNMRTEQLIGCELPEDHGLRVSSYLQTAGCW
jgi:hypothetical protein